ncbi:hypothetical protein CHS0354_012347 [Potamilus streckersoni]|uniref:Zinc finger CW-type PWWP domain protein 1 n=1 Tax=Potamilus streckersoni TaxID=2493646 RepID=A0AAE0SJM9_9BIVA|nr:hypothetical protein CHS0354_012347 [Potamilus streckersoni]
MQATKKKTFKSPAFTAPLKSENHPDIIKDNEQEHAKNEATEEKKNVPEKTPQLSLTVPASTPKDSTHDLQKESKKEKSEKAFKAKKIKPVDNDDSEKEKKKKKLREETIRSKVAKEDLSEVPAGALRKQDDAPKKPRKEKKKLLMRSLSDEEYKELFAAVIQIVVSRDSVEDENEPGEPGTIIDGEETLQGHDNNGVCKDELRANIDKEHITNKVEKVIYGDAENRMKGIKEDIESEEEEEDKEKEEESDKENSHVVIEAIEADEAQDQVPESTEDMQLQNEITPVGSEFEFDQSIHVPSSEQVKPAHKNKKKRSNIKKSELHPHHLPFSDAKQKGENNESTSLKEEKRKKKLLKEKVQIAKKQKFSDLVHLHKQKRKRDDKIKIKKKGQSRKKIMLERNIDGSGTWVQCCNPSCQKWRYLSYIQDPTKVPEQWFCIMNTNENFNSCDKKEEEYNESDHIFTKFTEGSIVWVKMSGYPWWPAMVEIDPDAECFFNVESVNSMVPSHYHVVFLDNRVSRAWIKARYIKAFTGKDDVEVVQKTVYEKDIAAAKENALKASELDLKDRIRQFGFAGRFRGKWGSYSFGEDSQESGGSQMVSKQVKAKLRKIHKNSSIESDSESEMSLEMIDEPIMSDLLNNTDSILEDMELVLESLESESLDEDSEYIPIKGKQKKGKDSYRLQQNNAMEKKNIKEERRDENGFSKKKSTTVKRKSNEYSSAKKKPTNAGEIVQSKDRANHKKEYQTLENEETSNLFTDDAEVIIKKEKHQSVVADLEMLQININKLIPQKEKELKPDQIITETFKFDSDVFTMELGNEYNDFEAPDIKSCDKKNQTVKPPIRKKYDVMVDQSTSEAFKLANNVTLEVESENHDAEGPKSFGIKLKMDKKTVCFDKAVVDIPELESIAEMKTNASSIEEENKMGVQEKDSKGNKSEDEIVSEKPINSDKGKKGKNRPRNRDELTQNKPSKKTIRVKNESPEEGQTSGNEMKEEISNKRPSKNSEPKFKKMKQLKEPSAVNDGGNDDACLEPKICDNTNKKETTEERKKKSFKAPTSVYKITVKSSVETKKCDLAKTQESKEEDERQRDLQEGKSKEKVEEDIGEEITFDLNSKMNVDTQIKVSNENEESDFDIDTSLYDSEPGSIKQNILVQMDNNTDHNDSDPFEMMEE